MKAALLCLLALLAFACEQREAVIAAQPPAIARGSLETDKNPPLPELEEHEPYRVGGEVKAPVVISRVEPEFGDVRSWHFMIFEAVITKDGEVRSIRSMKGPDDEATRRAMAAIKQWRFKPGTRNGVPVDVIFNLTLNIEVR